MSGESHYEVLGVPPTAGPDTIRRAYLGQARRWHPDRPNGNPKRMQAVNEAWRILSNPQTKSDYDRSRSLRGSAAPPAYRSPSSPTSRPGGTQSGGSGASARPQRSTPKPPIEVVGTRWRWLSLAIVAAIGATVALVLAFSPNSSLPGPQSDTEESQSLPGPGDCFVIEPLTVVPVGCDQAHDGKLSAWVTLGAPCPLESEFHWVRSVQLGVCYLPPAA